MKRLAAAALLIAAVALPRPAIAQITASSDPIIYWNDVAVKAVGLSGSAPAQARVLAMMNAAMYDAVNRTSGNTGPYYNGGVTAPGGDTRAAVATAAHDVLVAVNPGNTAAYNTALAASLAQVPDGVSKTNGVATGMAYASAMVTRRASDGSGAVVMYTPGTDPGDWRPTPPGNAPAAVPQWGGVTPFLMTSGAQFRPGAPPELGTPEYLAAYNEVKAIGSFSSATRTATQTASALFWDVSNGTTWIRIGVDLIADDNLSTFRNAQVMAKLSAAVADSLISGFDAKYTYNLWRPVTAIRLGDSDGVDETIGDATWTPLFGTPAHPSYVSTHSMQSGAASTVLLGMIQDQAFCNTIAGDMKCFDGIGQAAQDAANSRLWGGIHFRFDNETGLATGQAIGRFSLSQAVFGSVPEPVTWEMMIAGFGAIGFAMRRRRMRVAVRYS